MIMAADNIWLQPMESLQKRTAQMSPLGMFDLENYEHNKVVVLRR